MVDSALPQPGDIIAAKYRIERAIGDGGMSVVFGATHCVTGKRFAIKWLLPDDEAATSALAAQRFIREAQVAGQFQHPNVVEVYDVGEVSGSFYMVMEWLEGESLDARLARVGRLSLHETCAHLIPCMEGIEDAHAVGIVHRDLKPANIFVCQATKHAPERTKVLDFGIAKLTIRSSERDALTTQTGVLVGTPSYLSPEQLRNQAVDHRTDIYAFGVVLYQVLSGQLPFTANTFGELVLQIATSTPTPLSELAPELPPGVAEIVSRAMAREPAERFQNLRALIDALRVYADQAFARTTPAAGHPYPVSAGYSTRMATPLATEAKSVPPMASRASRASRPAARSVPVSVQVAVGLIGLVVGAGVWLQFSDHAKPVDSAVPPFIAVPAPVAQAPSAVSPATETAVMAATPASAPVNPDPLAKSAQASASPASGVQHPDAGLAVAEPNAPHVKPARVRALRSDAPARMPVASSPPPSAPAPAIDHNPLHMHIQ